jgi:hypothetical protein
MIQSLKNDNDATTSKQVANTNVDETTEESDSDSSEI